MATKRVINTRKVAEDIRSGLTDAQLMKKYGLTPKGLSVVLNKLVEVQIISFDDLQQREPDFENGTVYTPPSDFRRFERDKVDFPLPVYEQQNPRARGFVLNISENGMGVRGIRSAVHQTKTYVIQADEVFQVAPVVCDATCRWIESAREDRSCVGGYEVITFLSGDFNAVQHLMRALTLEERLALKEKHSW
jgi:hypothetical protein